MPYAYLDRGPWRACKESEDSVKGVFIESDDFTHDVRLYVNGDFANSAQRLAYAETLANFLNVAMGVTAPKTAPNS